MVKHCGSYTNNNIKARNDDHDAKSTMGQALQNGCFRAPFGEVGQWVIYDVGFLCYDFAINDV